MYENENNSFNFHLYFDSCDRWCHILEPADLWRWGMASSSCVSNISTNGRDGGRYSKHQSCSNSREGSVSFETRNQGFQVYQNRSWQQATNIAKHQVKYLNQELHINWPFLFKFLCRTHRRSREFDRIIIDFDLAYLGNNDIQASILNIPVGVKYEDCK